MMHFSSRVLTTVAFMVRRVLIQANVSQFHTPVEQGWSYTGHGIGRLMHRLVRLVAGDTEALIVGQVPERGAAETDQSGTCRGVDVVLTEPGATPAAADHSVLVAHDAAAGDAALRRDEQGRGQVS